MHSSIQRHTARGHVLVLTLTILFFALAGGGLGFLLPRLWAPPPLAALPQAPPERPPASGPGALAAAPLDGLAAHLGRAQAEILRLRALGERLAERLGLDLSDLELHHPPAIGGPETGAAHDFTIREIAAELGSLIGRIQERERQLDRIERHVDEVHGTAVVGFGGWPVRVGYLSSEFGFRLHPSRGTRAFHSGLDFAAPRGTPIFAVAEGVVTFSGRRNGYGRTVEIRHPDGLLTRYAHNEANLVEVGEDVRRHQKIATVGSSGRTTGTHVHFEVLRNGVAIDPLPFVGRQRPSLLLTAADDAS